ncbi:MAG: hypothetical protein QOH36_930 [Actinomycetota bacterium]|nr:hypothetical protein [Actinomycetota bacterium]
MGFRILALTGGGARGIFQSVFLERLHDAIDGEIRDYFDLIAATSTGALVGLALAHGIEPQDITRLYKEHAHEIFRPRFMGAIRRGSRYQTTVLQGLLEKMFGDLKLEDLDAKVKVLICTSLVNSFEGRILKSSDDKGMRVVEAALASSAAPTFFDPVVDPFDNTGYIDGGMWANDPSMVAVNHAITKLHVDRRDIRILTVGTGKRPQGMPVRHVKGIRTVSPAAIRLLLESTFSLQAWHADQLCSSSIPVDRRMHVSPILQDWIALDDAENANEHLPFAASREFEAKKEQLLPWLTQPRITNRRMTSSLESRYRAALNEITLRVDVPHRTLRSYTYYVGQDPSQDRCTVEVITMVDPPHKMAWRTERIGVTQGDVNVGSVDDLDFNLVTDNDFDAEFLPLEQRDGQLRVLFLFSPIIEGPNRRALVFNYAWPGTWNALRTTGEDRALIRVKGIEELVEVTIVFPKNTTNPRLINRTTLGINRAQVGSVIEGFEEERPTRTWHAEFPRRGDYELRIRMDPLQTVGRLARDD